MSIKGFSDLETALKKLSQPEKFAREAVKAAAPVLEKNLKEEIKRAANRTDKRGKRYSTGDLAEHIQTTKDLENELGIYSVVRPVGEDEDGMRYAERMAYLEYGVTSHGQDPRPVRRNAAAASEAECYKIMDQIISEAVDKLW